MLAQLDSTWVQPTFDYHAFAPQIVLVSVIVVMILVDLFAPRGYKAALPSLAGLGLLGAAIPVITLAVSGPTRVMFGGDYVVDQFTLVLTAVFLVSGYVVVLLSTNTSPGRLLGGSTTSSSCRPCWA
jgi:NADH-quinone oxidoreductase subunit N